jgi:hypothetical protein
MFNTAGRPPVLNFNIWILNLFQISDFVLNAWHKTAAAGDFSGRGLDSDCCLRFVLLVRLELLIAVVNFQAQAAQRGLADAAPFAGEVAHYRP